MSSTKAVAPGRNEAQFQAAQARRLSGAAGRHGDRRLKRQRDRGAAKRAGIKDAS